MITFTINKETNQNCYSQTNSLMYEIKTEDVSKDFNSDKEMFDFSNYSTKSKYYDDSSKSVIGKMEDETSGVVIEEFVGLKAKIYSYCMSEDGRKRN